MRREPHNEWMDIPFIDHQQDPREHGTYVTHTETGEEISHWQPKSVRDFLDEQHLRFESSEDLAHDEVKKCLEQHQIDGDPDQFIITTLYINGQDSTPQRANIAHSQSLVEAMVGNWQQEGSGDWFEHLGRLRDYREQGYPATISSTPLPPWDCFAYEGIFHKSSPQRFDEGSQLALDPRAFKQYVWDADLQAKYLAALQTFWEQHRDNYDLIIKAALLKAAISQHVEGSLSDEDRNLVFDSFGLDRHHTMATLELYQIKAAHPTDGFTHRQLIIHRYTATDILVIRNEHTGRLVMYIPGNSSPLHGFESLHALRKWIALQCKDRQRRTALESHFTMEDRLDGVFLSGIHTALAGLAAYPRRLDDNTGLWSPYDTVHLGDALYPSPFITLRTCLERRMASDAVQSIGTRADYDKKLAGQVLSACITVVGMAAVAVPELWVPMAMMSVALVGLGADEAMEGKTAQDRQEGLDWVVFGVLNALPLVSEEAPTAGELATAARQANDGIVAGAADEIGQATAALSDEERQAAEAIEQQHEAQAAESAAEQTSEDEATREARLAQEERERLARKSYLSKPVDAGAFGLEPEGLRGLSPGQRVELAAFEYSAPLGDLEGGWAVDDMGAVFTAVDPDTGKVQHFARVHAGVYPVEPVPAAGQYRVFSLEHPEFKGPYLKKLKGFYSDIDLKPGLRGGDSFIVVPPLPEPIPEVTDIKITQVRGQPPVTIEIPIDGIEVRPGKDASHRPADQYFANNVPGGTAVRYDADIACWRVHEDKLLWRNNRGIWKSGNEKAFLKVKHSLNFPVDSELYTFPRVPGISPDARELPLDVHQIWVGNKAPREALLDTMKKNVSNNPEINFTLHVDIDPDNGIINSEVEKVKSAFAEYPNMTISELADQSFFNDGFLKAPETAEPFNYFRHGSGQNLAAASDVLRYHLINEYGGIYLDCDDVLSESFKGASLQAGPDDVLTGAPVTSPKASFFGPGNSHFASHANNPVLRGMQKEVYARWLQERDALVAMEGTRGEALADGTKPYVIKIFEVTGPGVFLDTLKRTRPDYADLLDGKIKPKASVRSIFYLEYLDRANDFYMPFAHRLRISAGSENSWL